MFLRKPGLAEKGGAAARPRSPRVRRPTPRVAVWPDANGLHNSNRPLEAAAQFEGSFGRVLERFGKKTRGAEEVALSRSVAPNPHRRRRYS